MKMKMMMMMMMKRMARDGEYRALVVFTARRA
jgi:hypothetical protein